MSGLEGACVVDQVNGWVLSELPALNRDILAGRCDSGALGARFVEDVLPYLPMPDSLSTQGAEQMVVLLGLIGASLSRHYQERYRDEIGTPEKAFEPYRIGASGTPFRSYFASMADRTGTGHCHRDSYASLTRWNVPTTEVWWAGERLAVLKGSFDDGKIRTYTGTPEEQSFFELIKLSEAIELAINTALLPLSEGTCDMRSEQASHRTGLSIMLLVELRRFNEAYARLSASEGLSADYFMDVFRQYAVHWTVEDIPPSGALDPEWIVRDYLFGIRTPAHEAHTARLRPALLTEERNKIDRVASRSSLPEQMLDALGLDSQQMAAMSPEQLRDLLRRFPIVARMYLLLTAHLRMSGVHLKIAKKYLFTPQRQREQEGLGDSGVVSNRAGTTGMDETYLKDLTRARQHHLLSCLQVIGNEVRTFARLDEFDGDVPASVDDLLKYADRSTTYSPPIEALVRMQKVHEDDETPVLVGPSGGRLSVGLEEQR